MSFQDDLDAWATAEWNRRTAGGGRTVESIRRLLRGQDVGPLFSIDRLGFPGELRIARPPTLEVEASAASMISGWLDYYRGQTAIGLELLYEIDENGDVTGPLVDVRFNSVLDGTSNCNSTLTGTDGAIANKGSAYSGRMREYVQLLGGRPIKIPYNYQWCETHGVFINEDTGQWWIIEISQTNGVLATPVVWHYEYTEEEKGILGVTIPGIPDVSSKDTRILGHVAGAYAGAWPIYQEHGWAFSYTGHKAVLVSLTWPDDYQHSTVWQVDISTDTNGDPETAELSSIASAIIWGTNAFSPKFPYFTECGPTLLSLTMVYNLGDGVPVPVTNDIPLDAFFSPQNHLTPIIAKYGTLDGSDPAAHSANWPSGVPAVCTYILLDGSSGHYYKSNWTRQTHGTVNYRFSNTSSPASDAIQYSESTTGIVVEQETHQAGNYCAVAGTITTRTIFSARYDGTADWWTGGSEQFVKNETFFKPIFDREMMGMYSKDKLVRTTSSTVFHTSTEWLAGGNGWRSYSFTNPPSKCGGTAHYYLYAYPDRCEPNWDARKVPDDGMLHFSGLGIVDMDGWAPVQVEDTHTGCGHAWLMEGCGTTSHGNLTCGITTSPALNNATVSAHTKTWVWNNANSTWVEVYTSNQYNSFDSMTDFVTDPCAGSLTFYSHIDAFTGAGMTYKILNAADVSGIHFIGDVSRYLAAIKAQGVYDGWFGIPLPPIPG